MLDDPWVPTKRYFPVGSMTRLFGPVPPANGEPEITVGTSPAAPIKNAEMLLEPSLATKRYLPDGSTAREIGFVPALIGDPETSVRAPVEPIENSDTVLLPKFAT